MWSVRAVRQIELLAGFLFVIVLFSCLSPASSRRAETDRAIDDATIQAKVKSDLIDDPRIGADEVNLEVSRGVVKLVGWVDSDNERKAVEDLAWRVQGVKDVDNRLQLRQDRL